MPRDILSRSGSRLQQQLQPALLPDKKGGQRLLEGGAALGKLDFHAHAAHAKPLVIKKGVFTTEEKGFRRPMSFHEPLPL